MAASSGQLCVSLWHQFQYVASRATRFTCSFIHASQHQGHHGKPEYSMDKVVVNLNDTTSPSHKQRRKRWRPTMRT